MDEQLQKLILAQLQEIAEISRANQVKLERLDTLVATMQQRYEKDEAALMNDIHLIEKRLENLENFKLKLVVLASSVAFMITILWEVVSKFLFPFII